LLAEPEALVIYHNGIIASSVFLIVAPSLAILVGWLLVRWSRAQYKTSPASMAKIAFYGLLAVGFLCLWVGAADKPELFARGQWRLLGWAMVAGAAMVRWKSP
jgi:hypothetical protein